MVVALPAIEGKAWQPFKLDALGIITLLGTDSLRQSMSRLVQSGFVEYLPLLAPQIIADNTITNGVPGFTLFNITDGILATDLSAWWTRWLTCQDVNWNTTVLDVSSEKRMRPLVTIRWILMLLGNVLINVAIITVPVLLKDWYGFAASVSLVMTIVARAYILQSLRSSIDRCVLKADKQMDLVKLFLTLPSGKAVIIHTTRGIATEILLTEPQPKLIYLYRFFQWVDWISLGVLVVTLGSASLPLQIILIGIVLISTFVVVQRFGCDERHVGRRLVISSRTSVQQEDRRSSAYLNLNLSMEEEMAMISWHLIPMKYNTFWWNRYENEKRKANQTVF